MTKMNIIRECLSKMYEQLKGHDLTCVLFNNSFEILTTFPYYENNIQVKGGLTTTKIIEKILDVKCNGTTDFTQILSAIEIIKHFVSTERVSIILSDGHHTNYSNSVDNVKSSLSGYFDYSIGLGDTEADFDKELLSILGKNFLFGRNEDFVLKLFEDLVNVKASDNWYEILVPPQLNEFVVYGSVAEEEVDSIEVNVQTEDEFISTTWLKGETQVSCQVSLAEKPAPPKVYHFIMVIDISASMNEYFQNQGFMQLPFMKLKKTSFNFISEPSQWHKFKCSSTVQLIFSQPPVSSFFVNQGSSTQKVNIDVPNTTIEGIKFDKVFEYSLLVNNLSCYEGQHIKNMFIYDLYQTIKQEEEDPIYKDIKEYVESLYVTNLSIGEKKFLSNIEKDKDMILCIKNKEVEKFNSEKIDQDICLLCFKDKRTIVLSCYHVVMCQICASRLIESIDFKCPICRLKTKWIKKVRYVSLKCLSCDNKVSVVHQHCNHAFYCSACLDMEDRFCHCGCEILSTFEVIFS